MSEGWSPPAEPDDRDKKYRKAYAKRLKTLRKCRACIRKRFGSGLS